MNYELAKKLKDAGYPNLINTVWDDNLFHSPEKVTDGMRESLWTIDMFPTLSELIEACLDFIPDSFLDITSRGYRPKQWVATSSCKITNGETPEEAVARLWLALND